MKKDIFVVGNGNSLKDFDFNFLKDKEWIGCTLGFRHWEEELGFYPTYYVNVDSVVCHHHHMKIKDMIVNQKCKSFLLTAKILKDLPELMEYNNVFYIEQLKSVPKNIFRNLIDYCSGSCAVAFAYFLKADNIHMLGMDCNYIEFIPECVQQPDKTLKIVKTPKTNPNYYFDSYQRAGDVYNRPNTERVHKSSWFDLRNIIILFNILRQKEIKVFHYNTSDGLDEFFEKIPLNELNKYK